MPHWNLQLAQTLKELLFGVTPIIFILILCVVLAFKDKVTRKLKFLLVLACSALTVFCFKGTPIFLLSFLLDKEEKSIDSNYLIDHEITHVPACVQHAQGAVVLGGGIDDLSMPSYASVGRVKTALELLHGRSFQGQNQNRPFFLLFSGGRTVPTVQASEAQVLKNTLIYFLGHEPSSVPMLLDEESLNTMENAFYSKVLLQHMQLSKSIVLVTNTFHMSRAKLAYEKQGFQVCPLPCASPFLYGGRLFSFENAGKTMVVINEYAGLIGYALKGWI